MWHYWIVVADERRAKLLSKDQTGEPMVLLREFINVAGRASNHLFVDEGRASAGQRSRAQAFAGDLCELLDEAASRDAFDRLFIIAPEHFLGLIRASLREATVERLAGALSHDWMRLNAAEVEEQLREFIPAVPTSESQPLLHMQNC